LFGHPNIRLRMVDIRGRKSERDITPYNSINFAYFQSEATQYGLVGRRVQFFHQLRVNGCTLRSAGLIPSRFDGERQLTFREAREGFERWFESLWGLG
jgi:hypothetical protein